METLCPFVFKSAHLSLQKNMPKCLPKQYCKGTCVGFIYLAFLCFLVDWFSTCCFRSVIAFVWFSVCVPVCLCACMSVCLFVSLQPQTISITLNLHKAVSIFGIGIYMYTYAFSLGQGLSGDFHMDQLLTHLVLLSFAQKMSKRTSMISIH